MIIFNLIDRRQGETSKKVEFHHFNLDGSKKDLTGALLFILFRFGSNSGSISADLEIGSGLSWVNQSDGVSEMDQIDAIDWAVGTHYYDEEIHFVGGEKDTYVGGTMKINRSVTKPNI